VVNGGPVSLNVTRTESRFRPQPAAALVEKLAGDGYITPDEADVLRRLGPVTNEAAYGRLDPPFGAADIHALIDITRLLLARVTQR
jgi:hypothetical protein